MPKHTMHVVSHTHWDREFYLPFQEFRVHLIQNVDDLLDLLDHDPDFKHFHMDGHTLLVEDYLEIKPQNRQRIADFVKQGRLLVGPRYELNDHFLVSAEANVRNFLIGVRTAKELGGCMMVGYCADEFGMISQFPQILRGFGIDNAIFGRGLYLQDGRKMECIWQSPDGSDVLGVLLAMWFNNAQHVPVDDVKADALVERNRGFMTANAISPHWLLLNGVDQMGVQPDVAEAICKLNARLTEDEIVHSSLPAYVDAVRQSLEELGARPEVFTGELREDKFGHALAGTLSTRIYLKQANDQAQKLLERYTEPISTLAWTLGMDYPWHTLDYAWRTLLKNHPHDSICGCSCDEAHQEMLGRFKAVTQVGTTVGKSAFECVANDIKTDSPSLVVFNPLGWSRTDRVVAEVDFPLNELFRGETKIDPAKDVQAFELRDSEGNLVPFAVIEVTRATRHEIHPQLIMHSQTLKRFSIEFIAENVPGCGYKAYSVKPVEQFPTYAWKAQDLYGDGWIGNDLIKVEFAEGTVTLKHAESGKRYDHLNSFEDCGEVGDEYRHIKPQNDVLVKTDPKNVQFEISHKSPISVTLKVTQTLLLPESMTEDEKGRSDRLVANPTASYITVTRGIPRVDIRTEVENNSKDHRLRAVFPTGLKTDQSTAESQFDVVTRPIKIPEDWDEILASTWHPQLNWVDVSDGKTGLCMINVGMPEYELYEDDQRTLALTLLRCTGRLAILDNDHLATPTPDAQCQGLRTFEYSVLPHVGNWREAKVWKQAYERNVPMSSANTGGHEGRLPVEAGFVQIGPAELILTAVKRAEREDKLVVRFFNTTDEIVEGKVTVRGAKSAELMNLNEDPQGKLEIGPDGAVTLSVGPKKIVTLGFDVERLEARVQRGKAEPELRQML